MCLFICMDVLIAAARVGSLSGAATFRHRPETFLRGLKGWSLGEAQGLGFRIEDLKLRVRHILWNLVVCKQT